MKLLLDTHLLLWAAADVTSLSTAALELIKDPSNELYFSSISIWEVAIKRGMNRVDFQIDPLLLQTGLLANGYLELPFTSKHALVAGSLPPIHKDPFDRALIAQATRDGLLLVSADRQIHKYGAGILSV